MYRYGTKLKKKVLWDKKCFLVSCEKQLGIFFLFDRLQCPIMLKIIRVGSGTLKSLSRSRIRIKSSRIHNADILKLESEPNSVSGLENPKPLPTPNRSALLLTDSFPIFFIESGPGRSVVSRAPRPAGPDPARHRAAGPGPRPATTSPFRRSRCTSRRATWWSWRSATAASTYPRTSSRPATSSPRPTPYMHPSGSSSHPPSRSVVQLHCFHGSVSIFSSQCGSRTQALTKLCLKISCYRYIPILTVQ